MALDINGYNSAFKSFVDFAQNRIGENQEKAVADARIKKFNGEEVLTIAHVKTDEVHKWLRTGDECDVNDRTRAIFRAAVVNMFGGENRVPESVKKAMLMEDYDKGKPLTARRILAVKAAVDADGTAKARSATIRLETIDDPANEAAGLLRTHGTDMYSWNADIFAKFLVRLVTAGGHGVNKAAIAADTAKSIRKWRSVGLGDPGFAAFNEAAKNNVSNTIRKYMQPDQAGRFKDGIHETMFEDAHRADYILNGTTYNHKPANELIPAFKALVPDAKKQRALSIYLNQLCLETVLLPSTHVPYETGVEAHNLPGSDALVNRNMTSGLYQSSVLYTYQHVLTHDLKLSEDGRTATITQSITADLSGPGSDMNDPKAFGQVTFSQRLVIDLEPDIPVVTDYKLSQTIE